MNFFIFCNSAQKIFEEKKREITNKMASKTICQKVETLGFWRKNVELSNFWRKKAFSCTKKIFLDVQNWIFSGWKPLFHELKSFVSLGPDSWGSLVVTLHLLGNQELHLDFEIVFDGHFPSDLTISKSQSSAKWSISGTSRLPKTT